jgi:DNA-binding NarL/FixJ family response regulator
MGKIGILIADDHGVVVEGIRSAYRDHSDIEVMGSASNGREAIECVEKLKPDIVIMDISMPDINGVEASVRIKKLFPNTKIVIYTMFSDREYVLELFKIGISAYILKQDAFSDLLLAVNVVKSGGTYVSKAAADVIVERLNVIEEAEHRLDALSQRERSVFRLLADGKSIKEIAQQLYISPKTVETHKYNLMTKLGTRTIPDLTKIAMKYHLIKTS